MRIRGPLAAMTTVAACLFVCVSGLADGGARASAAAPAGISLSSGVETSSGSWVVLPMGQLSDPNNTFWQVLHSTPGPSHWSVVTPEGAPDNGGLVAGASTGFTLVGILPSQLLRFSPLSVTADEGSTWNPVFLPGALAARPDALADAGDTTGASLAIVGTIVLRARPRLASWTSLVSLRRLARAAPRCGATELDAVAVTATGAPLVATGCRRGGVVALFTASGGTWAQVGPALQGRFAGASTSVLRLETGAALTTVLVAASRGGHTALVSLWQRAGSWTASAPLALPSSGPVLATSVGSTGTVAVEVGPKSAPVGYDLVPGGTWIRLPSLPAATVALGPIPPGVGLGLPSPDAFTVAGTALGVYALTPARTAWTRIQSTEVPIAYGSSA